MSAELRPEEWVQFASTEYLDDFIRSGGAAVKFVVPFDTASRELLFDGLQAASTSRGFLTVKISSADTRVHMVDQVFFAMAEQMPWPELAARVLELLAREEGYALPSVRDRFVPAVAAENDLDEDFLRNELRRSISRTVFKRRSLAKDFRIAMTQLCLAQLASEAEGATITEAVVDWLTGKTRTVGAVKPYGIFTRVNRTNARFLLESLLDWIRFAGLSGMVVIIDAERLTLTKNPRDGSVYYTKASRLDAYELFRQFIDSTDRARGFMLVVVPDPEFLDLSLSGRGINEYQALKFRVYDEIRDTHLANPMAALVRVSTQAPAMATR